MRSFRTSKKSASGLSLIVTLVIAAGASVLVGGVLFYTSSQTNMIRRITQYDSSLATAVAATEKIVTCITKDFIAGGETAVGSNLESYRGAVPMPEDLTANLDLALTTVSIDVGNSGPGSSGSGSGSSGSGSGSINVSPISTGVNAEDSVKRWKKFEFTDSQGQMNRSDVAPLTDWNYRDLGSKFPGLRGYAASYGVISNVREKNKSYRIVSSVKQEVQIASVPLCQFQFFYVPDMELNALAPGMMFNGRIHCNGNMYLQPGVPLTFDNHVTASRRILHTKHPADPVARSSAKLTYRGERETGLNTLNLAIGTNAGPLEVHQLLEPPPANESPTSLLAKERFYNKADLIIVVSNDVVVGRSGAYNGGSVSIPWLVTRGIVTRNNDVFYDSRECRQIKIADVDLTKFAANYDEFTRLLGRPAKTLWIIDLGDDGKGADSGDGKDKDKPKDKDGNPLDNDNGKGNDKNGNNGNGNGSQGAVGLLGGVLQTTTVPPGAVRLRNGATLPAAGLTIATPNPLYVQGSYNTGGVPACLAADAVTVLSGNWSDLNSTKTLPSRVAANTTVKAAVIMGIVPTGNGAYSGGAENALRLLEDWGGKTLTFSGSLLVLYYSKVADAPWGGPDVYAPPTRAWSYDVHLSEAAKIPPAMPAARTVFRSDWTSVRPYSKL